MDLAISPHRISLALCMLAAATAHAGPPSESPLKPLVVGELPAPCRELAVVAASTIVDQDFAAHLSTANCLAEQAMNPVVLAPDPSSITVLERLAEPSLAIYDDILAHGDAHWKVRADNAKADLYLGMVVRLRSVTNDPADHAGIEPGLSAWLEDASRASNEATALAAADRPTATAAVHFFEGLFGGATDPFPGALTRCDDTVACSAE